jgi:hypothetical protein
MVSISQPRLPNPAQMNISLLRSAEQKLHILWRKLLQRLSLVFVDRPIDQIGLLFLKKNNPRLDRILDA